ncbi:hypothetical protein [Cryptosporangium minutisporangium]|uniref:Uncharacterized protein n=1 Tax=Cryptosporangium minutisporangium TaxID=113569 RepID=A0ABP6SXQ8_9ACTN
MRVSEYFGLDRNQPALDFLDVYVDRDVPLFIDPRAIRIQETEWSKSCEALLQSFFTEVLLALVPTNYSRLTELLGELKEPNETHLGYSKTAGRGRGLGGVDAENLIQRLMESPAAQSGLLSDLEDSALFVEGIDLDIMSDMTTHIIRGALIGYTQRACSYYAIPMELQKSGPVWSPDALEWHEDQVELPSIDGERLLLVPRSIARKIPVLDRKKFYRRLVTEHLMDKEKDSASKLVQLLKSGDQEAYRKELAMKYPASKLAIIEYSTEFEGALSKYKESLNKTSSPPLSHENLARELDVPTPDYDQLLSDLRRVPAGNAGATLYHRAAEKLLTALFYPHLANVQLEKEIHEGRKRIDICYDNLSPYGTFFWLTTNYHAPVVPVECKNYARDIENPELDQISSRFSDRRGWVGMIVCRRLMKKDLFLKRCRDTAHDGRGYILAFDDEDLVEMVKERKIAVSESNKNRRALFKLVRERLDFLIS